VDHPLDLGMSKESRLRRVFMGFQNPKVEVVGF
jgi:hypothetical protein